MTLQVVRTGGLLAVLGVAGVSGAAAQTVRGTVTDSLTGKGINAAVELLRPDSSVAVQVISSLNGRYELQAPGPGTYLIRVRRLGYGSLLSDLVELQAGAEMTLNPQLTTRAYTMAPVRVTAPRDISFLENAGYFRRKQETTGFFLDPDKVAVLASKARQTADVLEGIPGVTLLVAGGSWGVRVPVLTRQLGCAGTGDRSQWPRIYLDGVLVNTNEQQMDVNAINVNDLLAIEVYNSISEVPLQYGGNDAICGVLVLWTKH